MRILAGVDGGGTHTRAVLVEVDGGQSVMVETGPGRMSLIGSKACEELLVNLLEEGAGQLHGSTSDLVSVSICLSGIDSPSQSSELSQLLSPLLPGATMEVMNDAFSVLSAGTMGKAGLAVIGGTGSIAVGERLDGTTARAGGYGSVLGDEGSGFDIGRQGLSAAIRGFEGRGPKTVLWDKVALIYGATHPIDLVDEIYEGEQQVPKVASFAASVLEAAQGDEVAGAIIHRAAESYVQLILAVRNQLQDDFSGHVVLAGGLFQHSDVLQTHMRGLLPHDHLVTLSRPPVFGALMRAVDQAKRMQRIDNAYTPTHTVTTQMGF
ncbi:hypothetical protein JZ785_22850 [Alicyclobacillus curvatus]|nr:hypothetical protein JZ785_22850 [Alicyclobacillus curvatus]